MANDVAYDQDGNPIFPPLEELQSLIDSGEIDPDDPDPTEGQIAVFDDGDGTENRGDAPRLMVLR